MLGKFSETERFVHILKASNQPHAIPSNGSLQAEPWKQISDAGKSTAKERYEKASKRKSQYMKVQALAPT